MSNILDQILYEIASSNRSDLIDEENPLNKIEYIKRFEDEMKVIQELNQLDNILQAIHIKKIIEELKLPFFIRGSAGGSFVLFLKSGYILDLSNLSEVDKSLLVIFFLE